MSEEKLLSNVEVHPATAERWPDLEALFGERGAFAGCWCMFWRLERFQFKQQKGQGNKDSLRALLRMGLVPGLLAYRDGQVIGWCSVGPRENYIALERSRILKRVDEQPVWSIVCFFVAKPFRHMGLMRHLLTAALAYAREHGARIVEGYPVDLDVPLNSFGGYMGIASTYREVGFVEVARASATQPIMRYMFDSG